MRARHEQGASADWLLRAPLSAGLPGWPPVAGAVLGALTVAVVLAATGAPWHTYRDSLIAAGAWVIGVLVLTLAAGVGGALLAAQHVPTGRDSLIGAVAGESPQAGSTNSQLTSPACARLSAEERASLYRLAQMLVIQRLLDSREVDAFVRLVEQGDIQVEEARALLEASRTAADSHPPTDST